MITRLAIVAEGLTESEFVRQVLKPHLEQLSNYGVVVNAPKLDGYRTYAWLRKFVRTLLRPKSPLLVTTMIDLFKIPGDFPGRTDLLDAPALDRVRFLERLFTEDIADVRFQAHLQLHEFEALVLVDLPLMALQHPNRREAILELSARLGKFQSPEHVNHLNPPSYRIKKAVPEYDKR